jgi:hypothetical protein
MILHSLRSQALIIDIKGILGSAELPTSNKLRVVGEKSRAKHGWQNDRKVASSE